MIVAARQARTANTHAPLQERAATATGRIRDLYRPSMRYWAHARYTQQMSGAVAAVLDASGRGTVIDQATASKQPLAGTTAGARAWVFDGVNDCLATPSITLADQITVSIVHRAAATTGGAAYYWGANINAVSNANAFTQNDIGINRLLAGATIGGGSYNAKEYSNTAQTWGAHVQVWDRALAGTSEMQVYRNGAQITVFTTNLTGNSSGNFGSFQHFFGAGNNGAVAAANCSLASVLLLTVALGAADAANLSLLMQQAAGVV